MSTKTFKGQLVSSKLKKYDHKTGEYFLVEDTDQSYRIGTVSEITYKADKGLANKLHSLESPALGTGRDREYYLNGVKYTKDQWMSLKEVGKLDGYIDRSLY